MVTPNASSAPVPPSSCFSIAACRPVAAGLTPALEAGKVVSAEFAFQCKSVVYFRLEGAIYMQGNIDSIGKKPHFWVCDRQEA